MYVVLYLGRFFDNFKHGGNSNHKCMISFWLLKIPPVALCGTALTGIFKKQ